MGGGLSEVVSDRSVHGLWALDSYSEQKSDQIVFRLFLTFDFGGWLVLSTFLPESCSVADSVGTSNQDMFRFTSLCKIFNIGNNDPYWVQSIIYSISAGCLLFLNYLCSPPWRVHAVERSADASYNFPLRLEVRFRMESIHAVAEILGLPAYCCRRLSPDRVVCIVSFTSLPPTSCPHVLSARTSVDRACENVTALPLILFLISPPSLVSPSHSPAPFSPHHPRPLPVRVSSFLSRLLACCLTV